MRLSEESAAVQVGPEADVVVSSRIRLARNVAGFPYVGRCNDTQRNEVITLVARAPLGQNFGAGLTWASRWGARAIHVGASGHINEASGHGPWPDGLTLFERFREAHQDLPSGALDADPLPDDPGASQNRGCTSRAENDRTPREPRPGIAA
jgi:hypothetical protein